jgi:hypothetical protein
MSEIPLITAIDNIYADRDAVLTVIGQLPPWASLQALDWAAVKVRQRAERLKASLQPMDTAPRDGTVIRIRFEHSNFRYASGDDRFRWEQICDAYWTNFNNGGWVWHGLAGHPTGWMPAEENAHV